MNSRDMKLINLAFRVPSLGVAGDEIDATTGWSRNAMHAIDGEPFLEASLGDVRVNLFETALYDDDACDVNPGFLHASFQVRDLEAFLSDPLWVAKLAWGPTIIKGGFGHRRIAFFETFPGCRIELMEEVGD
ncbi:MAG: hypothetical protein M9944_09655 [Rhizobiaceae bacterium]|nr:hypothetical protein [Rhizobiaceae bacterium]